MHTCLQVDYSRVGQACTSCPPSTMYFLHNFFPYLFAKQINNNNNTTTHTTTTTNNNNNNNYYYEYYYYYYLISGSERLSCTSIRH